MLDLTAWSVYSSSQQFVRCLSVNDIRDLLYVFLSSSFLTLNIFPFSISTITSVTLKDFFWKIFVSKLDHQGESFRSARYWNRRCLGFMAISCLCNVYYVTMGKLFICIKQRTPYFHICWKPNSHCKVHNSNQAVQKRFL